MDRIVPEKRSLKGSLTPHINKSLCRGMSSTKQTIVSMDMRSHYFVTRNSVSRNPKKSVILYRKILVLSIRVATLMRKLKLAASCGMVGLGLGTDERKGQTGDRTRDYPIRMLCH